MYIHTYISRPRTGRGCSRSSGSRDAPPPTAGKSSGTSTRGRRSHAMRVRVRTRVCDVRVHVYRVLHTDCCYVCQVSDISMKHLLAVPVSESTSTAAVVASRAIIIVRARGSDSLRGSYVQIGTMQIIFAWPLGKDDTHTSRSVNIILRARGDTRSPQVVLRELRRYHAVIIESESQKTNKNRPSKRSGPAWRGRRSRSARTGCWRRREKSDSFTTCM